MADNDVKTYPAGKTDSIDSYGFAGFSYFCDSGLYAGVGIPRNNTL